MQKSNNVRVAKTESPRIDNNEESIFSAITGSMVRATVHFFKNIPNRIKNYFQRKYKEAKKRPKRKDINRVYYLVGYTTKTKVDSMYRREKSMMILRRGMLILITILLLVIAVNRITESIDFGSYSKMFGVEDTNELTRRDPFSSNEKSDN